MSQKKAGAAAGIPALLIDDLPYPVVGGEGEISAAGSIEDMPVKGDGYGRDTQENPDLPGLSNWSRVHRYKSELNPAPVCTSAPLTSTQEGYRLLIYWLILISPFPLASPPPSNVKWTGPPWAIPAVQTMDSTAKMLLFIKSSFSIFPK